MATPDQTNPTPDDENRGQPSEPPAGHVSARVPNSVSHGKFATGVIVMSGPTEFVLDFVQGLVRPAVLVARVFMPHIVLSQFAHALRDNLSKYEQRFGAIPTKPAAVASASATPIQQLYDELKIDDEMLPGKYANAVMINHGASEFKLDFLVNIVPRSAVSCRVFFSAAQIPQVLASLDKTWTQFQQRVRQPPKPGDDQPQSEPE